LSDKKTIEINKERDDCVSGTRSKYKLKKVIPEFITDVFDIEKPFSKSDLDILTELYKLLEKNIE
jgi:hypothetical protein